MSARFLLMPEWQGSAASRAMRIAEGADLLREDLPRTARIDVPVPSRAGDALGTPVSRLSSIIEARDAAREIIERSSTPAITLGGDCASTLAGLQVATERYPDLAVLWCDAHGDLQHPATSPSGAASGMTLRHALGDGVADLAFPAPLSPEQVLLVGTRELDPEEAHAIEERSIRTASPLAIAESVAEWLDERRATRVYIHIDLDVIDPAEFGSVQSPVPFGIGIAELAETIRAARRHAELVGAAICEFAPPNPELALSDQATVLRVLAALTGPVPEAEEAA